MGRAMLDQRPHRADGALALRALAFMTSILEAATEGRKVKVQESSERPPALAAAETRDLLRARGEPRDFG
jgi:hypothetical protein